MTILDYYVTEDYATICKAKKKFCASEFYSFHLSNIWNV